MGGRGREGPGGQILQAVQHFLQGETLNDDPCTS